MKKLLILLGLLLASPAFAVDNTVIVTPGTGVTMRSKDVGSGVESMIHILGDTTGNPIYGTAGAANANILTVQGIASMTPFLTTTTLTGTLPAFAATPTFNLGTLNGAATAANQGTTADAPCTLPASATACSEIAVQKAIANAANGSIPAGTNPIGSVSSAPNVTPTDCSGTVSTGGTAVNAFTAQTTLHGFTILNDDTSEPLWISFTTTAAASTAASYPLAPATATSFAGASSFTSPPGFGTNHALSVVAATSAHKFSCTWW